MNKSYLIVPAVLLAGFLVFERNFQRERAIAANIRSGQEAAKKAAEETRLAGIREQTARESQARAAEREKTERERVEKKQRDAADALQLVEREAAAYAASVEQLSTEAATLEQALTALRARKQGLQETAFAHARHVEEQRVERRNADLEIQRTSRMVATRLLQSPITQPPAPPPAIPAAR